MNSLQWALLIVGVGLVAALVWYGRRESGSRRGGRWTPPAPPAGKGRSLPGADQMDIFGATGQFDEFGVGRPRKVGAAPAEPRKGASSDLFGGPESSPKPPQTAVPAFVASKSRAPAAAPAPKPGRREPELAPSHRSAVPAAAAPGKPVEDGPPVVLFVAEREGRPVPGVQVHAALKAEGLEFGEKAIYHRVQQGMVQFSVASLIKPGTLDPAEAEHFATPGLTVYMVLPGPIKPLAALEDLFTTCDRLAAALNGEVFDQNRQALTEASRAALRERVRAWAQRHQLA